MSAYYSGYPSSSRSHGYYGSPYSGSHHSHYSGRSRSPRYASSGYGYPTSHGSGHRRHHSVGHGGHRYYSGSYPAYTYSYGNHGRSGHHYGHGHRSHYYAKPSFGDRIKAMFGLGPHFHHQRTATHRGPRYMDARTGVEVDTRGRPVYTL